jgi:gas vesicle protein
MADEKKSSKLGLGILIGTVIGGLAAFFLSPKSGEENREKVTKKIKQLQKLIKDQHIDEKVKEIFGDVSDEEKKSICKLRIGSLKIWRC